MYSNVVVKPLLFALSGGGGGGGGVVPMVDNRLLHNDVIVMNVSVSQI